MAHYVVPVEGAGTREDPRRPKYVPELGVAWAAVDHDDTFIVWAQTDAAQHSALAANADVIAVPALDTVVAPVATRNALEGMNVPAQWVSAGMTYRQVLRVVVGMAQLIQASDGWGAKLRLAGRMDTALSDIPATMRIALSGGADRLGLDRSSITDATTVRTALRILGQQFIARNAIRLGDL